MRLLLVEDHVPLADELMAGLNRQGYAVDWLADGRDAAYQGRGDPYDRILLDLGLPGLPGLEGLTPSRAAGAAPLSQPPSSRPPPTTRLLPRNTRRENPWFIGYASWGCTAFRRGPAKPWYRSSNGNNQSATRCASSISGKPERIKAEVPWASYSRMRSATCSALPIR